MGKKALFDEEEEKEEKNLKEEKEVLRVNTSFAKRFEVCLNDGGISPQNVCAIQ